MLKVLYLGRSVAETYRTVSGLWGVRFALRVLPHQRHGVRGILEDTSSPFYTASPSLTKKNSLTNAGVAGSTLESGRSPGVEIATQIPFTDPSECGDTSLERKTLLWRRRKSGLRPREPATPLSLTSSAWRSQT